MIEETPEDYFNSLTQDLEVEESGVSPEEEAPQEKTPIEKDNELIDHATSLVDKALDLSRENGFCEVSFDYTQLELIRRTLQAGRIRGDQIGGIVGLLDQRRESVEASLDNMAQALLNFKEMIPKINIK